MHHSCVHLDLPMNENKNVRRCMIVLFGPFEVDLEGRRLLKRGMRIGLREQSFQVLAALIERPGEIVTRQELRQRLWPSDAFVDFEVSFNTAISRLREALGDSHASPPSNILVFIDWQVKVNARIMHLQPPCLQLLTSQDFSKTQIHGYEIGRR